MKKLESIKIYATLEGTIWMPPVTCEKEVKLTLTPEDKPFTRKWNGLRDAILHLTNDGDFQNCKIAWNCMIIRWREGKNVIERTTEIPYCKLTQDCMIQS